MIDKEIEAGFAKALGFEGPPPSGIIRYLRDGADYRAYTWVYMIPMTAGGVINRAIRI